MNRIAPVLKCHLGLSVLVLGLAACSPAPQPAGGGVETATEVTPVTAHAQEISVHAPWVRQPPPSARVAAGYMRIDNPTAAADRLLAVESDAAARVEIHEMEEVDGIMRMREVEGGLELPAAGHVELEPGGYHLMLMEPREGLAAGQRVQAEELQEDQRPEQLVDGADEGAGGTYRAMVKHQRQQQARRGPQAHADEGEGQGAHDRLAEIVHGGEVGLRQPQEQSPQLRPGVMGADLEVGHEQAGDGQRHEAQAGAHGCRVPHVSRAPAGPGR